MSDFTNSNSPNNNNFLSLEDNIEENIQSKQKKQNQI